MYTFFCIVSPTIILNCRICRSIEPWNYSIIRRVIAFVKVHNYVSIRFEYLSTVLTKDLLKYVQYSVPILLWMYL